MRHPDRAGFETPLGSVIATRQPPEIMIGDRTLNPGKAADYRDAITAALEWLGAVNPTETEDRPARRWSRANVDPWAEATD